MASFDLNKAATLLHVLEKALAHGDSMRYIAAAARKELLQMEEDLKPKPEKAPEPKPEPKAIPSNKAKEEDSLKIGEATTLADGGRRI